MKKLITILLMLVLTSSTNAQWVIIPTPGGNGMYGITNSGTNLFGINGPIVKSTDNGLNWVYSFGPTQDTYAITTFGLKIFVGTSAGIYSSTDDGVTWIRSTPTFYNSYFTFGKDGDTIYAGGTRYQNGNNLTGYLKRYIPQYDSWTDYSSTIGGGNIYTLVILGRNVFAGTHTEGINLLPIDIIGGRVHVNNGLPSLYINSLAVNSTTLYAGVAGGLYRSTNNGTNWVLTTLGGLDVKAVTVYNGNVFAATSSNVFMSTNNGANWINKTQNFVNTNLLYSLPILNNYIFACAMGFLWRRSYSDIISEIGTTTTGIKDYHLAQNYPNPWNPTTSIKYSIPKSGLVTLKVYNILGKEVTKLVNDNQSPGTYTVDFQGAELPSGIYFYRLQAGNYSETKQMILIK